MILLIKNGHVINPATETDEVLDVLAEDGKVVKLEKNIKAKADRVIDAKGCYVMPGFIDMHVHLRDPGQEQKETIETGCNASITRSAFALIFFSIFTTFPSSARISATSSVSFAGLMTCPFLINNIIFMVPFFPDKLLLSLL